MKTTRSSSATDHASSRSDTSPDEARFKRANSDCVRANETRRYFRTELRQKKLTLSECHHSGFFNFFTTSERLGEVEAVEIK